MKDEGEDDDEGCCEVVPAPAPVPLVAARRMQDYGDVDSLGSGDEA